MTIESVSVRFNGQSYYGWTDVEVDAGAAKAARSFTVKVTEPGGANESPWIFPPGAAVDVMAREDLLVRGYVDDYAPEMSEKSHSITVSGRGKGQDFIDCSPYRHATGRIEDKDLLGIAQELDEFGVGISSEISGLEKIPWTQVRQGESAFEHVARLAQAQGVLLTGQADGSIKLMRAGQKRHAGALVQGQNIEKGSAKLSMAGRHSKIKVKGQSATGTGKGSTRIAAEATDENVPRHRPKVIIAEGETDNKRAKKRAKWEASRRAGESTTASLTVFGWRDEAGVLWEPNRLVYVSAPFLRLEQDLAIKNVKFCQGHGSKTVAHLSLCDPRALGGKKPGKTKSDQNWEAPEDDE